MELLVLALAGMAAMLWMNYNLYKRLKEAEARYEEKASAREQRVLKAVREAHEEALDKMLKAFKSERRVWEEMMTKWRRDLADAIAESIAAALGKAFSSPCKEDKKKDETPVEPLHHAIRLPPVEYVKGELEFGARPPFKLRGVAGNLYVLYEDGEGKRRMAVIKVAHVSTDGKHVVVTPTPKKDAS